MRRELLKPNNLDEEYALHHVRFILTDEKRLEKCGRIFVVALPADLHTLFNSMKDAPSDIRFFYHQFMTLQLIVQLYDGFDELFNLMIDYDDFESYKNYEYWKIVIERAWMKNVKDVA